jgi:signal transduction histidine kinase/CheY-like chemotaxis protein
MTFLSNMRISTKILFLLSLLIALSAAISGFAAYNISSLARGERALVNGDAASMRWAASAQEHMTSAHQFVFQINSTDFSASGGLRSGLIEEEDGLKSDMGHFRAIMSPDETPLYRAVMARSSRYMAIAADNIRLLRSGDRARAEALLLSSGVQAFDQADASFDQIVGRQVVDLDADAAAAAWQARQTLWLMVLGSTVGGACVGALALFAARREISEPLTRINEAMTRLAAGVDAEPLASTDRRDEIGDLSRGFTVFRENAIAAHNLRVEAERATVELARTAAALRSAFRIAQVGGWEIDFVARQATFSDELCDLLRVPHGAALPLADTVSVWIEEDRAQFEAALAHVEGGGERLTFEGRTPAPDGSPRWWRLVGEPVVENGRCVALRGAAQEMTDWRDMQERERAALQAADAMSTFLATMSHELRTPLNGVLGMAQAMARDELSSPQRERLTVIEGSGGALLCLLNDLLDLSKIEAGKTELEDGIVDVQALTDAARSIFTALVRDKDVGFHISMDASASGYWRGDPTRVRQVLHNLISNAVKFTERGSITVELSHRGENLVLRVADTGIGIASDKLGDVFERFVQADATMTRRHGGSGLGLTICRDLVSLMGGHIQVESVEGAGSTFTVSLPLRRAVDAPSDAPAEPPAEHDAPAGDLRILAAEDNATNQIVLKTLLGQIGIEPTLVWNGQEALDACREGNWDIILMDIQMPVMDGLTAVRAIRKAEQQLGLRRTPVIAVTANAMPHHRAEYLAAGMDAMVAKPIDFAALLEAMDAAMTSVEADHPQALLA